MLPASLQVEREHNLRPALASLPAEAVWHPSLAPPGCASSAYDRRPQVQSPQPSLAYMYQPGRAAGATITVISPICVPVAAGMLLVVRRQRSGLSAVGLAAVGAGCGVAEAVGTIDAMVNVQM